MFVTHIFATDPLPPIPPGLYQYVIGANGVFVRARRPGLEALLPVATARDEVRGLPNVLPFVRLDHPVPAYMLEHMFLRAWREGNKEILFYLRSDPTWKLYLPKQAQSAGSVYPLNPFAGGADTLLEVHSHHHMDAYFSATDNRDERAGFRLFAVLGNLDKPRPRIRVRVGIYGHFWEIPASWVFDLPPYATDALRMEKSMEMIYVDPIETA
jgi:PRTRC genetic system protein A